MSLTEIPSPVIAVISEILGSSYTHSQLNTLFLEHGASEEIPLGNKVEKCRTWLNKCNKNTSINSYKVLGKVLEDYMEADRDYNIDLQLAGREKANKILVKYGLSYRQGGFILGAAAGISTQTLHDILKNKDLQGVEQEFQRAINTIESDPPSGLTAACSIIESLCKIYIEDEKLSLPSDQTIKPLWKIVSKHLGLDPSTLVDDDLKKILTGLIATVDGLGALRTHGGSAHGRGRTSYRIEARHARLAAHAAHTLCVFIIETWLTKRKINQPQLVTN